MTSHVSDRSLLEIVEHIYAASCDSTQWDDVAAKCQRLFPGSAFSLHVSLGGAGFDPLPAAAGWDPHFVRRYREEYYKINPFPAVVSKIPEGSVVRASQLVTRAWLDRQQFYHEWLKPSRNFTHGSIITLFRKRGGLTRLSYAIPEQQAHLEPGTAEILCRVGPHFRRALEIAHRLGGSTAREAALTTLLEQINDYAIAVDSQGRVLFANQKAIAALRIGDVIKELPSRGLTFVEHRSQEAFSRTFQACLSMFERASTTTFTVPIHNGEQRIVHVLPLRLASSAAVVGHNYAVALVLMGEALSLSPEDSLRKVFGLSNREAAVVLRIGRGATPRETAKDLCVSLPTVRNQLAAGMLKLGVHRRAELVGLIAQLTPRIELRG